MNVGTAQFLWDVDGALLIIMKYLAPSINELHLLAVCIRRDLLQLIIISIKLEILNSNYTAPKNGRLRLLEKKNIIIF
jgi:hypothetical protein